MPHRSIAKVRTKQMPCKHCGELMTVGSNKRNLPNHLECGIKIAIQNNSELQAGRGQYFERWLASCIASRSDEGRATPPTCN